MEPESYLNMDELDDDVFYPDDFGYSDQTMTSSTVFNQSQSYTCLLGRFHLFPLSHCCGPGFRGADYEDKATQTLGSPSISQDIMLPCGVSETPQRLFYGHAGYLLYLPLNSPARFGEDVENQRQEQSAEHRIARKLQCIGDQFHRFHLHRWYFTGRIMVHSWAHTDLYPQPCWIIFGLWKGSFNRTEINFGLRS
ncbi:bcl-2-modifying factor isoform X2 [Xenopus laevis]|uniref:Bcl-2-modifying factor isoform X2 n=1 Tax=Xenopus laevis TaxID=8355 RepID=A0A8J1LIB7_XENLA|nr:bcl-2-modifying factor isoform X2 [Xenopus laevis]